MTDFQFRTDEVEDPEVVSEFSMDDYEKYRLKTGELTLDLAIASLEDRDADEYMKQRKNEIADSDTKVPHPYKPEKQDMERPGELVEFSDKSGKGFADPEYNLVPEGGDQIVRYRYQIRWIKFPDKNKLCEIEIYAPKSSGANLQAIAESIEIE